MAHNATLGRVLEQLTHERGTWGISPVSINQYDDDLLATAGVMIICRTYLGIATGVIRAKSSRAQAVQLL